MNTGNPWTRPVLFALTEVTIHLDAQALFARAGEAPFDYLRRHQAGDWSDEALRFYNLSQLAQQGFVRGVYRTHLGETFWITTDLRDGHTIISVP